MDEQTSSSPSWVATGNKQRKLQKQEAVSSRRKQKLTDPEVPVAYVYTNFTLKEKPESFVAQVALMSTDVILRWIKAYSHCAANPDYGYLAY